MYKELMINVTEHETRVALLEDGTIVELFVDRPDNADIAGNIYKGRVQRVLPGMQAAFIDIGLQQAAFIYVDDVYGDHYEELVERFDQHNNDEEKDKIIKYCKENNYEYTLCPRYIRVNENAVSIEVKRL